MRLNVFVYGVLVLAIFMGTIFTARAAGYWSTSGRITSSGEAVTLTGADVDEIKGWMTLGDVAAAYGVPEQEILAAFKLPLETPPAKQLKELESDSFSATSLREWLKERLTR